MTSAQLSADGVTQRPPRPATAAETLAGSAGLCGLVVGARQSRCQARYVWVRTNAVTNPPPQWTYMRGVELGTSAFELGPDARSGRATALFITAR